MRQRCPGTMYRRVSVLFGGDWKYVDICVGEAEDVQSSDDDIRGPVRRRQTTPFGGDVNDFDNEDRGSEAGSVQFVGMQGSDGEVQSGSERDEQSEAESVGSGDEGRVQRSIYDVEVQREVDQGEDLAESAREQAARAAKPDTPSDSGAEGSSGRARKRKRSLVDESDADESDEDSLDRMVPFIVHGFCQGCRCKQNVYVLGPVKKRRVAEADRILMALQERYKIPIVRGDRRTIEKPGVFEDS